MAVAWASTAGWMRRIGQVTAVVTSRPVVAAMPPITDQTNGDWPWLSIHGWKWSEMVTVSNPARSAMRACSTRSRGPFSSEDRKHPNVGMGKRSSLGITAPPTRSAQCRHSAEDSAHAA